MFAEAGFLYIIYEGIWKLLLGKSCGVEDVFKGGGVIEEYPRAVDMYHTERGVIIGGQRSVERVVGVGAHQNIAVSKAAYYQRVVKIPLHIS